MPKAPSRHQTPASPLDVQAPKRAKVGIPDGPASAPAVMIRRSEIHGRGLFAVRRIPRGARIGIYEGPKTLRNGAYVLWVDEGGREFGIAGKNDLRFVNHSKRPNAVFEADELFSLRAIAPGEEITFDYGADWD